MNSMLATGLSRLLRAFTPSQPLPEPPAPPKPHSPKSYESFLSEALSPTHPLNCRHQLPANVLTALLTAQTQLVNLSTGPTPIPTHEPSYNVDDLTRPPRAAQSVSAALNGCVWDSRLVQAGFAWTERSVWFIPLDASLLERGQLDRHFRMVATVSTSESRCVVLYPEREVEISGFSLESPFEDIESFMKLCGFAVDSCKSLAELAGEPIQGYEEYMSAIRIAVVRPAPRVTPPAIDTISEITYISNDISSQAPSAEFDDYLSSDRKMMRFELDISSLPAHLATKENEVVIIGSESCVGCWDPRNAKRMTGRVDTSSVVVADIMLSVFAGELEYKYAIVKGEDIVEWEAGWNRHLEDSSEISRDEWRCP